MKKANQIISHLKNRPFLKNLEHIDCYNQLLSLLPNSLRENTRFLYHKNDTLFFVLNHPGIKMEFNYKSNLIKSILKTLILVNPKCIFMNSSKIKAFVTNKIYTEKQNNSKIEHLTYKERAKGEFKNEISDEELRDIFEKIRQEVKKQS